MRLKEGTDLTILINDVYRLWLEYKPDISLAEMRVINKIFYYHDKNINCGHKELVADLNIPSSALSKLLKRWLDSGEISTKQSKTDKRRNFYYPSELSMNLRNESFERIKNNKKNINQT